MLTTVGRSPLAPLKKGGTGNLLKVPLFKGDLGGSSYLLRSFMKLVLNTTLTIPKEKNRL